MDDVTYHTQPSLRITPNMRNVVELALRMRKQEHEVWPDGRSVIHQPELLVRAVQIVHEYADEFEAGGKKPDDKVRPKDPAQGNY